MADPSRHDTASYSLDWILAPLGADEFLGRYLENECLHLARQDPTYYSDLFSFADVDRSLFLARESSDQSVTVIPPPGSDRPRARFRAKELRLGDLYNTFHRGDTIRLTGLQCFWPAVGHLTSAVQEALDAKINVNFYLTRTGSQGFPVHFDTHDVLILQVGGSKDWSVYEPTLPLPIGSLEYPRHLGTAFDTCPPEDQLRLRQTVRLRTGDLLYMPRGFPHKAVASDEPSLHLTLGLHAFYWVDALKAAVDLLARDRVELRRMLPAGFFSDSEEPAQAEDRFRELLAVVAEEGSLADARRALTKAHHEQRFEPPDGHIQDLVALDALTLETPVERRVGLPCTVSTSNGTARIDFGANFVTGPARLAPALEFVRNRSRFRGSELPPDLPEGTRLVLIRRLVREGLLRIARPG